MLRFSLLLILTLSCTSPEAQRGIASLDSAESDQRFKSQEDVQEAYNELLTIYSQAYDDLELFDQSLDAGPMSLYENPHYHKLIASRIRIEQLDHELESFIELHFGQVINSGSSVDVRRDSLEKLKWISSYSTVDYDHLYQYIYFEKMNKFSQELLVELGKKASDPMLKELDDFYLSLFQKFSGKTPNFKQVKKQLKENNKNFSKTKENISRSIESLAQEIKVDFNKNSKNLNSARFYPTTERAGNITGNEFPAKIWSLTFDDGPGSSNTLKVLNNLKKHSLRASFFQVTKNAKSLPQVTKTLIENGMEIACHSYGHRETPKLNPDQRNYEIRTASQDLAKIAIKPMQFYRLPYGAGVNVADIRSRIASSNMIHVFWNVDTLDWMAQPPADIVARTIKQVRGSAKDAGVILFHDIHDRTVIASEEVMRFLNQDNRKVCVLEEIVENLNRGLPACGN
jgi:peptidoglycan/xylan/chitin deacetylase (PgdA/CDA1 family)